MTVRINVTGPYGEHHAEWLIEGEVRTFPQWYEDSIVLSGMASYFAGDEKRPDTKLGTSDGEGKALESEYEGVEEISAEAETIDATEKAIELAAENAIDLSTISGSGRGGRILVGDVRNAIDS